MRRVRVLVCRVGRRPVVERLAAVDGSYLDAMQGIVGGLVDRVPLDDGCDVWFHDEGLLYGLPPNRRFPVTVPAPPEGFVMIVLHGVDLPEPGSVGVYQIVGDLFIARSRDGELADVTDEDVAVYSTMFADEDPAAAERMDRMRPLLRR